MQPQTGHRKRHLFVAGIATLIFSAAIAFVLSRGGLAAHQGAPAGATIQAADAHASATASEAVATAHRRVSHALASAQAMTTPLPPPGTPLKDVYDTLKARADGGDEEAASRLYHDVHRCARVRDMLHNMPRFAALMLDANSTDQSPERLLAHEKELANVSKEIDDARAHSALCDGLSDEQLYVTPVALRAAQLGDVAASDCYVGISIYGGAGVLDHPEWLMQFKQDGLGIAKAAVAKGDWTMVAQLEFAYHQMFSGSLLAQLTGSDPAQGYAYLKLRRLGARGKDAAYFDSQLAVEAQGLPADVISAGDAWAQDTYQHYFGAKPTNDAVYNVNICQSADD
jgi:hypothetical protein